MADPVPPYRYIGFGGRPPQRTRSAPFIFNPLPPGPKATDFMGFDMAEGEDRTVLVHRDIEQRRWIVWDETPDLRRVARWLRWRRFKAWLRRPWRLPPKYPPIGSCEIWTHQFPLRGKEAK